MSDIVDRYLMLQMQKEAGPISWWRNRRARKLGIKHMYNQTGRRVTEVPWESVRQLHATPRTTPQFLGTTAVGDKVAVDFLNPHTNTVMRTYVPKGMSLEEALKGHLGMSEDVLKSASKDAALVSGKAMAKGAAKLGLGIGAAYLGWKAFKHFTGRNNQPQDQFGGGQQNVQL